MTARPSRIHGDLRHCLPTTHTLPAWRRRDLRAATQVGTTLAATRRGLFRVLLVVFVRSFRGLFAPFVALFLAQAYSTPARRELPRDLSRLFTAISTPPLARFLANPLNREALRCRHDPPGNLTPEHPMIVSRKIRRALRVVPPMRRPFQTGVPRSRWTASQTPKKKFEFDQ